MNQKIFEHYLKFSQFTYPGWYREHFVKHIPNDVKEIAYLIRTNTVHRVVLGMNIGKKEGMQNKHIKMPWYRYPEDDLFPTVGAMMTELFRRDKRGLYPNREWEKRIIVTCRFVSILMASILKTKGIPARVRSGFAAYFEGFSGKSMDHWIVQYWKQDENRWVNVEVDGCLEEHFDFDPIDMPMDKFDYAPKAWLLWREQQVGDDYFKDAVGHAGFKAISWELFHDFHCLMNHEIIYPYGPKYLKARSTELTEKELEELDDLARLMQDPDKNFNRLLDIWEKEKKFRILKGGLL